MQRIFWKCSKSSAPATQNDFWHVMKHVGMSRSATPATRNEATQRWKAPKVTPFAELPIGTAMRPSRERLRTVADGCGRSRTVADVNARSGEHSSTPTPPEWNGNPCYAFGEKQQAIQKGSHARTYPVPGYFALEFSEHAQIWPMSKFQLTSAMGNPMAHGGLQIIKNHQGWSQRIQKSSSRTARRLWSNTWLTWFGKILVKLVDPSLSSLHPPMSWCYWGIIHQPTLHRFCW